MKKIKCVVNKLVIFWLTVDIKRYARDVNVELLTTIDLNVHTKSLIHVKIENFVKLFGQWFVKYFSI